MNRGGLPRDRGGRRRGIQQWGVGPRHGQRRAGEDGPVGGAVAQLLEDGHDGLQGARVHRGLVGGPRGERERGDGANLGCVCVGGGEGGDVYTFITLCSTVVSFRGVFDNHFSFFIIHI